MHLEFSEEQRLLKESVDRLLAGVYDFEQRKKYMKEKGGWSKLVWQRLTEQGLVGLPLAESKGGFDAGAVETMTMIMMKALGRALVLKPYLSTVVIGGGFLRHGGSAVQKAEHIPAKINGCKTLAFAQLEKNSRYTSLRRHYIGKEEGWGRVIDGEKLVIINGENAKTLIVTARSMCHSGTTPESAFLSFQPTPQAPRKNAIGRRIALHAADIIFVNVEIGTESAPRRCAAAH